MNEPYFHVLPINRVTFEELISLQKQFSQIITVGNVEFLNGCFENSCKTRLQNGKRPFQLNAVFFHKLFPFELRIRMANQMNF